MDKYAQPNEVIINDSASMLGKAIAMLALMSQFDETRANDLTEWLDQYELDLFRASTLSMTETMQRLDNAFADWYARLAKMMQDYAPPFTTLCSKNGKIAYWQDDNYPSNVSKHYCNRCGMYCKFTDLRVLHDYNTESLMYHTTCMSIMECSVYAPGHEYQAKHTAAWYQVGVEIDGNFRDYTE